MAKRGAMLFSIVASLVGVRREYQFSLPFFHWMFDQAIGEDQKEEEEDDDGEVSLGGGTSSIVVGL